MEKHVSKYPNTFYRVSVKAVIRNDKGEVLVNKEHGHDSWGLPGGGWDHGETEHESLARELYEEIGYEGEFTAQPFATALMWMRTKSAHLLWIVYNVETANQNFRVGEDSSEIAFMDPSSFSEDSESASERWIKKHLG